VTWIQHHSTSERLAADAEIAARRGDVARSHELYRQAAEAEELGLAELEPSKSRTLGISAVSAVSLYYKAAQLQTAELLAHRWLTSEHLPSFAGEQLRGLLQSVWSEQVRERANVAFAPGQVIVSVKGGQVVEGGAPLELIVEKVQIVQALFYRTAEFLLGLPHRKHGGPTKEILEKCRPWLFQASPGSYQFAVAVQEPKQRSLFDTDETRPQEVADHFLNILRASAESPEEELPALVPDANYRNTFLKLTRNLAPSGKRFSQLELRSATETRSLSLLPSTRQVVNQAIRAARPSIPTGTDEDQTIRGLLRAVHLDEDWIEVTVDGEHIRVNQVGEAVDDVIGPMVNHPVVIQVTRDVRGKLHFRDIETDE
jgi:hypothetical protein